VSSAQQLLVGSSAALSLPKRNQNCIWIETGLS
jgi:hypothetical protein